MMQQVKHLYPSASFNIVLSHTGHFCLLGEVWVFFCLGEVLSDIGDSLHTSVISSMTKLLLSPSPIELRTSISLDASF